MFLLNNIDDRPYTKIYSEIGGVVFDISDHQLNNAKNHDWHKIGRDSIACVINSSRKISTFYLIEANRKTDAVDEFGHQYVIIGFVVAKSQETGMTTLLNRYSVHHPYLPGNIFSNGFNVADLGSALDALPVKSRKALVTLGELKSTA